MDLNLLWSFEECCVAPAVNQKWGDLTPVEAALNRVMVQWNLFSGLIWCDQKYISFPFVVKVPSIKKNPVTFTWTKLGIFAYYVSSRSLCISTHSLSGIHFISFGQFPMTVFLLDSFPCNGCNILVTLQSSGEKILWHFMWGEPAWQQQYMMSTGFLGCTSCS